jgi:hypothetical protein
LVKKYYVCCTKSSAYNVNVPADYFAGNNLTAKYRGTLIFSPSHLRPQEVAKMEEHRTYSTSTVAKKAGIPKYKMRHWCNRYLPEIQKIDIGEMQHRRFTDKGIE